MSFIYVEILSLPVLSLKLKLLKEMDPFGPLSQLFGIQPHSQVGQQRLLDTLDPTASHVRNWPCPPAG